MTLTITTSREFIHIMKFLLAILLMLAPACGSASEPFSIRCEGKTPATQYFATFDEETKTVIFESPPVNPNTFEGANAFAGEISPSNNRLVGRIEFTMRVVGGKLSLTYDAAAKKMIWPGLNDATSHSCSVIATRSILSFRSSATIAHPISMRCSEAGYMYLTLDVASKRVVFERDEGPLYQGEVTADLSDEIDFILKGGSPGRIILSKTQQTVTFEGPDGTKGTPKKCEQVAPRTMIEYYKRLN